MKQKQNTANQRFPHMNEIPSDKSFSITLLQTMRYMWNRYRRSYEMGILATINEIGLVVVDKRYAASLYEDGAFGKGALSRGLPTWYCRHFEGMEPSGISEMKRKLQSNSKNVEFSCEDIEDFILSPEEAFFLHYIGILEINFWSSKKIWDSFYQFDSTFPTRYCVYHMLRTSGWIPKSGLTLGFDFVVYKQGPQYRHAEYCVWIINKSEPVLSLNAKNRSASNVKKVEHD